MDSDNEGSSGSAVPDYDTLSTWKGSTHSSADSGYRSMDSMPSERKGTYPSYSDYTMRNPAQGYGGPIQIINNKERRWTSLDPSPSYIRATETLPRKEQDRKRTLAQADITTRKEKRASFVRDYSLYPISERSPSPEKLGFQRLENTSTGTSYSAQLTMSRSPISSLVGALIAEQFVRAMESVCPSAKLCPEHDVPENLRDQEEWKADRQEYEVQLVRTIYSYIRENTVLTQHIQSEAIGKLLSSAPSYIAKYMVWERPVRDASARAEKSHVRRIRFSPVQSFIGEGGDFCTEPVESISTTRPTMAPILDDSPLFIPTSSSLYMAMDNAKSTTSRRDPARDLEDRLHASFTNLITLEKFRDLAYECHALWYIYFSRRKMADQHYRPPTIMLDGGFPVYRSDHTISTNWDPTPLLKQLQDIGEPCSIKRILTITGTPQIAYAVTCEEYVAQTWPTVGPSFLGLVDNAIHKQTPESHYMDLTKAIGSFWAPTSRIEVRTLGVSLNLKIWTFQVPTIFQMLAWMSAALRAPEKNGEPELVDTSVTEESDSFGISTTCTKIEKDSECRCWMEMLDLAVIAYGFPIPERNLGRGLEVSMRTACEMVGAAKAYECAGGPVIQGLSGLLVPVRSFPDGVQWHLVVRQPGQPLRGLLRLLQKFPNRIMREEASEEAVNVVLGLLADPETKCYIGWHPKAVSRAGTDSHIIDYAAIRKSGLRSPGQRFQLKNFTIGFQQIVTAEVEMGAVPIQSTLYLRRRHHWFDDLVLQAANDRILLYDAHTRRGWLLSMAEVVLHLLRRQLMPHTSVKLDACTSAEETLKRNGQKAVQDGLKIQDIIMDKLEVIERLQTELSNFDTNRNFSTKLFGFDFLQCAERAGSFVLREAPIAGPRFQQSWVDLIHASDTPVLFGNGFGELIGLEEPDKTLTCATWRQVPCDANLMTATAQVLRRLYAEEPAGDTSGCISLTHLKLVWDQGQAMLQEACHEPSGKYCCQRVQMLRTRSVQFWRQPVKPPASLPESGAVIFGDPDMVRGATKNTKTIASWKRNGVGKERQSYSAGVLAVTEAEVSLGLGEMTQIEERTRQLTT